MTSFPGTEDESKTAKHQEPGDPLETKSKY
jgi:hypothetical protein